MAPFLSRIFSVHKRTSKERSVNNEISVYEKFDGTKQVRVLFFREQFGQERRLLFDSKAIRKRERNELEPCIQIKRMKESSFEKSFKLNTASEKDIYEWQKKQSSDEQMLREMIFGSISTSYHGIAMKVHTIRCPSQIMISMVYPAPSSEFRVGELEESGNSTSSAYDILISKTNESDQIHLAHSVPVNLPSRSYEYPIEENDSFQSLDVFTSLPTYLDPKSESLSIRHSGSYNNLQRRLLRNKATSIQLGLRKVDDSQVEEFKRMSQQNRIKLGLSVVISLDEATEEQEFQDFLFTHIAFIENHLMKLRAVADDAYLNRKNFFHLLFEGSKKLQNSIQDLYTTPRLRFPEWLSIITSSNYHDLSDIFMQKFSDVLKEYDKKETNFFVSTVLTAVLTHHLAWVPTVIPTDAKVCDDLRIHKHVPLWVSILAKSRPYNPLWVQLGDLYGAVSRPSKIAKIVVKGQKNDTVMVFLQILSYFIRCSDVCEHGFEKKKPLFSEEDFFCDRSQSSHIANPLLYKSFGWSLMASISNHYLKDFCLQGINDSVSEEEIKQDLQSLTQIHILGEPISEAVCILIDTDTWAVQLQSSNWPITEITGSSCMPITMSSLVGNICESLLNMKQLGLPSGSCIVYLEDRLQELYCHSLKLSEYVRCSQYPTSLEKVASVLNFDLSDIPLLLSIATIHSPKLTVFKL